jgi:lipopolysaccharide transport system ATP-binding protein
VYFLNAGVVGTKGEEEIFLHRVLDACMFRVLPDSTPSLTGFIDFACIPTVLPVCPSSSQALI